MWPELDPSHTDRSFSTGVFSCIITQLFGVNLDSRRQSLRFLRSDEPGVAKVLDEDLVDEAVLRQSLNHHHPLATQIRQNLWDVQRLKHSRQELTD